MTTGNKRQYVTVRLPDDIMAKLKAEAERNTRSLSAQVLHYLKQGLEKVKAWSEAGSLTWSGSSVAGHSSLLASTTTSSS